MKFRRQFIRSFRILVFKFSEGKLSEYLDGKKKSSETKKSQFSRKPRKPEINFNKNQTCMIEKIKARKARKFGKPESQESLAIQKSTQV